MVNASGKQDRAGNDLLFVYGTLRRGCDNPQAKALGERCEWLGTASVSGRLFRVDWYPAFIPGEGGIRVRGDLFGMGDPEATLAFLDAYEECGPGFPEPWEYRREIISVEGEAGTVSAWTYIYGWPTDGLPEVGSGDWLAR